MDADEVLTAEERQQLSVLVDQWLDLLFDYWLSERKKGRRFRQPPEQ